MPKFIDNLLDTKAGKLTLDLLLATMVFGATSSCSELAQRKPQYRHNEIETIWSEDIYINQNGMTFRYSIPDSVKKELFGLEAESIMVLMGLKQNDKTSENRWEEIRARRDELLSGTGYEGSWRIETNRSGAGPDYNITFDYLPSGQSQ